MKASRILTAIAAAAAIAGLAACEWGAGSDATSWSDTFNWVNFSGVYRTSGSKTVTKTSEKESGGTLTTSESSSVALTGKAFTVIQQGQNLSITHNGSVFSGKISSMRSASGYENRPATTTQGAQDGVKTEEAHGLPPGDDTIIASFEAAGPGGRMVGTFQGRVYDTNTDGKGDIFGSRTLTATLVGPKSTTQIEAECLGNTSVNIFYPGGTNGVTPASGGSSSSSSP